MTQMNDETILRVAKPADAKDIAAIYAPFVRDTAISFETMPPAPDEMLGRITSTLATHPWLVAERGAKVLGYAYASPHRSREAYRWACDVTVYLSSQAQGCGIGSRLYSELLRILASQGFRNAFGGIALPNDASVALHEKMGFRHLGTYSKVGYKLGKWHDVGWWQKSLGLDEVAPQEVIPFAEWTGLMPT